MTELEWLEIFGDNLRYILEDTRYTQEELADCIGTSQSAISSYINKLYIPSLKNVLNLSYEFGLSVDEFINFYGELID